MSLLQIYDFLAVELEEVREVFDGELRSDLPMIADLIEEVGKFRGKMLRPILVLLCGRACGPINPAHRTIAAVAEMVHMATLVHDDVLDEADYRRRGPTLNALHGNEAAVIMGDLCISHAFRLCSALDSPLPSRLIAATTNTLCEGELMQLYYRGHYGLTEERYLDIITRKTAQLIATCCYLGAWASGANAAICAAFETFGLKVGMAFQIMDDILDLAGAREGAGKTLGTDLLKEKLTLPLIHFLRQDTARRSRLLQGLAAAPDQAGRVKLLGRLDEDGSLAYARRRARLLIRDAKRALPQIESEQSRDFLVKLADQVIGN